MIKFIQRFYIAIIFVFLYAPIAILVLFSFNAGESLSNFEGFSLQWYADLFQSKTILNAFSNTLSTAILSTLIAAVIGTIAAIGINNMKPLKKSLTLTVSNIPVLSPDIVTGVSLMMLFAFFAVSTGYVTVLLAHIAFNIPYMILSVMPRLRGLNKNTYEAALDLGAKPLKAFWDVVFPEILPGIISGMMICFTMSIDDFIISYFTKGQGYSNLSILIYTMARRGVRPTVNALSTIMFVVIISLLLIVNLKPAKTKKKVKLESRFQKRVKLVALGLVVAMLCTVLIILPTPGTSGNVLYLYNWGLYIDESIFEDFEERYGIMVVMDTYDSNEVMYQSIANANYAYDVMIPSDYMISKLISEDMLQEIDMSKITNLSYIDPSILEMSKSFDPQNSYSVPYTWGTLGIIYNPSKVTKPVNSWDILWDADYSGHIFMYDSLRDTLGLALKRQGYSLNSTNLDELNAAVDSLIAQKPLAMKYVGDEVIQSMKANEAWMGVVYNGDAVDIMSENPDLRYAIPEEGTNLFVDAMVIPKNAENVEAAHLFINFMCETEIAYRNSVEIGYSTPHTEAYKLLEADFAEEEGDEDYLKNYWSAYWPLEDVKEHVESGSHKYETFYDLGKFIKEYESAWNKVLGNG